MDCIIPGQQAVKRVCCAIGSLSKIGKEMYVDFDPLEGLTLRTLNDGKSAFASFQFEPTFFKRCSSGMMPGGGESGRKKGGQNTKKRPLSSTLPSSQPSTQDTNISSQGTQESRYSCRVPLRSLVPVVKARKGVVSLRIHNETVSDNMYLSFEFTIEKQFTTTINDEISNDSNNYNSNRTTTQIAQLKVVHRINVSDADIVAAIAPKDEYTSEILVSPKIVLRMIDPLTKNTSNNKQKTSEIALIVNDTSKVVTITSFHHNEVLMNNNNRSSNGSNTSNNVLLQASAAAVLKTETTIGCDEFFDYDYRGNVALTQLTQQQGKNSDSDDNDDDDDNNEIHSNRKNNNQPLSSTPPDNINQTVTLVFSIKEVKAMLQFCSQSSSSSSYGGGGYHDNYNHQQNEELRVSISFHWGGKPIIFETDGESFTARLIMATLDYKLLGGSCDSNNSSIQKQQQQQQHQSQGEEEQQ